MFKLIETDLLIVSIFEVDDFSRGVTIHIKPKKEEFVNGIQIEGEWTQFTLTVDEFKEFSKNVNRFSGELNGSKV